MVCVEADTVGVFWRKDSIIIPFSHFILAPSFSWKTFLCLCLAGGLQLLRQATHSCGLCTNCALCLQHCSPRHLRVSFLILCWFLPKHFCMEGLSMRNAHGDLTSQAPHERLPKLPVLPHETPHWRCNSRKPTRRPLHREMMAFFSCIAWRAIPSPLSKLHRRLDSL